MVKQGWMLKERIWESGIGRFSYLNSGELTFVDFSV